MSTIISEITTVCKCGNELTLRASDVIESLDMPVCTSCEKCGRRIKVRKVTSLIIEMDEDTTLYNWKQKIKEAGNNESSRC